MIYAVLDTNVIVSALMSSNPTSPTKRCLKAALSGNVCPLYNDEIISEYREVLTRAKFNFGNDRVNKIIDELISCGLSTEKRSTDECFPDKTDQVFFEVALARKEDNAKVITGNLRHYPISPIVVTPAQFCEMFNL